MLALVQALPGNRTLQVGGWVGAGISGSQGPAGARSAARPGTGQGPGFGVSGGGRAPPLGCKEFLLITSAHPPSLPLLLSRPPARPPARAADHPQVLKLRQVGMDAGALGALADAAQSCEALRELDVSFNPELGDKVGRRLTVAGGCWLSATAA